jgi:hypothetical protein
MVRQLVYICITFLLSASAVFSQDTRIIWQKTIGGIGYDRVDDIVTDAYGDAYVLATIQVNDNHQVQVSKISAGGDYLWTKVFGGERDDTGKQLLIDKNNNLIVLGASNSNNILGKTTQGSLDLLLLRLSGSGELLDVHTYGGSEYEEAASILQKPNGNYIITATTLSEDGDIPSSHGQADVWCFEIDPDGTIVWSQTYGGLDDEYAVKTALLSDNSLITVASTNTYQGDYLENHGDIDIVLYRCDAGGNMLWKELYGGFLADYPADIIVKSNGNYLIAANTFSSNADVVGHMGGSDAWLIEVGTDGDLLWSRTYGAAGNDRIEDITSKGSGFVLFGSSNSAILNTAIGNGSQDFWMYEINGNMEIQDQYLFGASGFDKGVTFALQPDGSILMGGESNSNDGVIPLNLGKNDGWLLRVKTTIDEEFSEALVHPNPTKGLVYVNELQENAVLFLTNMQGAPIHNLITPYGTSRILDLSAQPAGVYLLTVQYPERREVHRIIRY